MQEAETTPQASRAPQASMTSWLAVSLHGVPDAQLLPLLRYQHLSMHCKYRDSGLAADPGTVLLCYSRGICSIYVRPYS